MKKKNYKIFLGCVFLIFLLTSISVFGKSVEPPKEKAKDDTAPYFFVEGDPKVDHFPLLGTKVNVNIAGFIADVELKQTYKNEGSKTIEAVYVFPLTTHSAIYGMQMKIGTRIIDAEIKEKQEAKKVYEDAKKEGKTASLLEQKRPNVFQMNVANILPGEMVEVTVKYTETLIAEEGIYEFVFPTVVGPRYTGESDPKEIIEQDKWLASPYTEEKMLPQYKLAMDIKINSGVPVSDVSVKTHQVDTYASNKNSVGIKLSRYDTYGGNRDFILHYSLKGEAIESGLLLYPGKDEKFFMLTAEPPKRIDTKDINPREYVFIVDVSGSMNGFPLDVSKALIKQILED
ncbi:MAG: VIT and VWA domain-containing protein, partial [bacterium]|nr:VIT and VWA domain-containing protein [bacterium]